MLAEALGDADRSARSTAAAILVSIQDAGAEQALIAAMNNHSDIIVRRTAAERFATAPTAAALDALIQAARDPDESIRMSAIEGLGKLKHARAIDALSMALADASAQVKQAATAALTAIEDPRAAKALETAAANKP